MARLAQHRGQGRLRATAEVQPPRAFGQLGQDRGGKAREKGAIARVRGIILVLVVDVLLCPGIQALGRRQIQQMTFRAAQVIALVGGRAPTGVGARPAPLYQVQYMLALGRLTQRADSI